MGRSFVQTDTAAGCGLILVGTPFTVACTGTPKTWAVGDRQCVEGGSAGSNEVTVTISKKGNGIGMVYQINPGRAVWKAGTWTVPIRVSTPPPPLPGGTIWYLTDVWVCRVLATCTSVATVGHWSGSKTIGMGSPITLTVEVNGAAQTPIGEDRAYICARFAEQVPKDTSIKITPNQTILTPLESALTVIDHQVPRGVGRGIIRGVC